MGVLAVEEGEVSDFGIQNIMGDRAAASIVLALNLVLLVLMFSTLWNKGFTDSSGKLIALH